MSLSRFVRVRDLFMAAMALPPESREKYLRESADDPALALEAIALLAHVDESTAPMASAVAVDHPARIGPYRILGRIGEGGMGAVYKAEQREPLRRIVALKIIKAGFDTREVVARFNAERHTLARMEHPGITRAFDAGVTEGGRPYFVMEYVPGRPITQFADANTLNIPQRLELFVQVCQAVHHAHTKAVIHRDLKASNVLAFLQDGVPRAMVIDFGVAKALTTDRPGEGTFFTTPGAVVGTYEGMSPEQADGSPDVDTRTDVYSLGALLYELLAGTKPFERESLRAGDQEVRRIIREVDPERPSTRLTGLGDKARTIARARRQRVDRLTRTLRRELEWIPLKAMRKERDRRYAGPLQMADDIQNYLAGRPLTAAPESEWYRMRKFVHRNRTRLGVLGAAVLITVLIGSMWIYVYDAARRERALSRSIDKRTDSLAALTGKLLDAENSVRMGMDSQARRTLLEETMRQLNEFTDEYGPRSELLTARAVTHYGLSELCFELDATGRASVEGGDARFHARAAVTAIEEGLARADADMGDRRRLAETAYHLMELADRHLKERSDPEAGWPLIRARCAKICLNHLDSLQLYGTPAALEAYFKSGDPERP